MNHRKKHSPRSHRSFRELVGEWRRGCTAANFRYWAEMNPKHRGLDLASIEDRADAQPQEESSILSKSTNIEG